MSTTGPDIEALQGLSGDQSQRGILADSPLMTELERLDREAALAGKVATTSAVESVEQEERNTRRTGNEARIRAILIAANIDPDAEFTVVLLASIGDTPGERLAILESPEGVITLRSWVEQFEEIALVQQTPYSVALEQNAFEPLGPPPEPSTLGQARGGRTGIPPSQYQIPPGTYEYSDTTGAIRYPNGTIVTEGGGIIFDPTKNAPGSDAYLRAAADWDAAKLAEWKDKLVAYGYLTKEQAKGDGLTIEVRNALQSYWHNWYIAGGKPIASEAAGGGATKAPLIDYKDFSAQIQNDTRDQLRRILGAEPTEEQVRAQAQYIMHTATDLQRKFRNKDYGSPGSMALTEATETAIGNIETSPYAQDVRENTALRDALSNAAYVSRGLLS